jgi:hypothetical protein
MDPPVQNIPATQAVMRHERVAAIKERIAICDRALVFSGASAAVPPTNIAIDAKWAKPHRAYVVITIDRGSTSVPLDMARARSW